MASVKIEFDQELDRMGKVTREVASSAHKGLVTALEVATSTDRKVSGLEEVVRNQVNSLQGILDQTQVQRGAGGAGEPPPPGGPVCTVPAGCLTIKFAGTYLSRC